MEKKFICEFDKCKIVVNRGISKKTGKSFEFYALEVETDLGVMSLRLSDYDPAQAKLILIANIMEK